MSNAPVYYALAQAHFNRVGGMPSHVDQIQDRLRREGYPLFEEQQVTHLVVPGPGHAHPLQPQLKQTSSWLITRSDHKAGFVLTPSAVTYHTTDYETHDKSIGALLLSLDIVHEVAALDHVSRLGLRYLNAVLPSADESVEQYLVSGVHGVGFVATPRHRLTESIFETETGPLVPSGTLMTRVHRMAAPLGFPPDLQPGGLMIHPKFQTKEPCEHAVIDTDHFVAGPMPVDGARLRDQMLSLHQAIKSIFNATITDYARDAWA